ncbi:alkaline phosphatase D family protein [Anatilimnocola floriformis]|uniref:alkaline phosphatase D family protein n=1 Tax=Anatilimnocola floriformis TaxID=2948575 RepID=UPI0020C21182|nr:alkaline phosphatase D family protein [Anatilimnocola floriformis]
MKSWLFPYLDQPASRRSFLATGTSLAAAALWADRAQSIELTRLKNENYPFQIGVASGDPSPTGFVIWTRLCTDPLNGGGLPNEPIAVQWEVAEDEKFAKITATGKTSAVPEWGHSVHVEVEGLQPDRWYFYRFRVGMDESPLGRAKTFPTHEATTKQLKFAFASCQHFESGLFTAYEHMLKDDLDLVVHLGDYIYEGAGQEKKLRKHVGGKLLTLADYRNRHAQYKSDTDLQAMHAAAPWLVTWDDHEFENNYSADIPEERKGKNPPPTREKFLAQRARAYQAYYEHMPLRRATLPKGPDMLLYRRVSYGRLAEFCVLDTRQYRSDQPHGDGRKDQGEEALSPKQTILGDKQEAWLKESLKSSQAQWNILAQQVMMARVDRVPDEKHGYSMDQWPGYEMNRRRILKFLHEQKIPNPVVLTGDIHSNWANNLIADFDDLDSRVVASEFVGTSLSSGGDGVDKPKDHASTMSENPFVKFFNTERGYVRCHVTDKEWRSDYQVVPVVTKPGGEVLTRASFVVESGKAGVETA